MFLKIYNLMMAIREREGLLQRIFSTSSRGNSMASASCSKRQTYKPLAIVVEKLQNLLSCLKLLKYFAFLIVRFQEFAFAGKYVVKFTESEGTSVSRNAHHPLQHNGVRVLRHRCTFYTAVPSPRKQQRLCKLFQVSLG